MTLIWKDDVVYPPCIHSSNSQLHCTLVILLLFNCGSSIYYIREIFGKTSISYFLIRTRTCSNQGVRNVSLSETFAYVLNECSFLYHVVQEYFHISQRKTWSYLFFSYDYDLTGALSAEGKQMPLIKLIA